MKGSRVTIYIDDDLLQVVDKLVIERRKQDLEKGVEELTSRSDLVNELLKKALSGMLPGYACRGSREALR